MANNPMQAHSKKMTAHPKRMTILRVTGTRRK